MRRIERETASGGGATGERDMAKSDATMGPLAGVHMLQPRQRAAPSRFMEVSGGEDAALAQRKRLLVATRRHSGR